MSIRPLAWSAVLAASLALLQAAAGYAASPTPNPSATPRGATVATSASPDASTIAGVIALVVNRNPSMLTYSAQAVLDVRQLNFPYLHPVLQGMEFFAKPGYTIFNYPHTPFYMKGITKVQGTFSNATRWPQCFDITMKTLPDVYQMHMVPKVRGEIAALDVTVGRSGTLDHVDWYYWENPADHVGLTQHYSLVNGNSVVTSQDSEFTLHHIRARGTQTFGQFQFNVPVPTPQPTPSDPLHQCDNPQ
jgi:hypothetical protein